MNAETSTSENLKEWTEVLTPGRTWLDFRLREVWRYRDLIWRFFRRDFVASYKQTVLGPLWFVIPPLITTFIFTVVFGRIGRMSTNGQPDFLFFMLGVTAWNYFAVCLTRASTTFTTNSGLFGKVYFPRLVVPLSTILTNLMTFAIQFAVFLVFAGIAWWQGAHVEPNWRVIILPVLLVHMAALGLGVDVRTVAKAGPRVTLTVVLSILVLIAMSAVLIRLLAMAGKL